MIDCQAFERELEAYLAGELAPAEYTEMEQHRLACADCQTSADRAERLATRLRDGLLAAAAMSPAEQIALRKRVLDRLARPRSSPWRRWAPRLVGLIAALVVVIAASLILLERDVPAVSAAEVIARAQAAQDEHAGLSGVLHWETSIEQRDPRTGQVILTYDTEIWFDLDDPGRYHLYHERRGSQAGASGASRMVRNGVDRLWTYEEYEGPASPTVDEIVLSPTEMQNLASWHVPAPFRDDLARFADVLSDVQVVGETTVAGRRAYLLRGRIPGLGPTGPEGTLRPITYQVTLVVDADTYWLLGREEMVEGETEPRIVYRTRCFELLTPEQVPASAFTFTPPEGVEVRHLEGIEGFYRDPRLPHMTLEEAAGVARFVLLTPTVLPDDLESLPYVLHQEDLTSDAQLSHDQFLLIYRGGTGRLMILSESMLTRGPAWGARLVNVGDRQGWLEHDLIDSQQFTIYLPDWEAARQYGEKGVPAKHSDRLPPGSVILRGRGLSVDEALAVLESLEPWSYR